MSLYLESEIRAEHFEEIIGESPLLREVLQQVQTVAPTDATVGDALELRIEIAGRAARGPRSIGRTPRNRLSARMTSAG